MVISPTLSLSAVGFDVFANKRTASGLPALPPTVANARDFRAAVRHTSFAAARDAGRPSVLYGVHIRVAEWGIGAMAQDGYRIAVFERQRASTGDGHAAALVHWRAAEAAAKLAAQASAVGIEVRDGVVSFYTAERILVTPALTGHYPHWNNFLPSLDAARARADKSDLVDALARARRRMTPDDRTVTLTFRPDRLELTANATGFREGCLIRYEGEPARLALDARHLRDALNALPSGPAEIRFDVDAQGEVNSPVRLVSDPYGRDGLDRAQHFLAPLPVTDGKASARRR